MRSALLLLSSSKILTETLSPARQPDPRGRRQGHQPCLQLQRDQVRHQRRELRAPHRPRPPADPERRPDCPESPPVW